MVCQPSVGWEKAVSTHAMFPPWSLGEFHYVGFTLWYLFTI